MPSDNFSGSPKGLNTRFSAQLWLHEWTGEKPEMFGFIGNVSSRCKVETDMGMN
jgi:hypothetical protein